MALLGEAVLAVLESLRRDSGVVDGAADAAIREARNAATRMVLVDDAEQVDVVNPDGGTELHQAVDDVEGAAVVAVPVVELSGDDAISK